MAAEQGDFDKVKNLVGKRANVNIKDDDGVSTVLILLISV